MLTDTETDIDTDTDTGIDSDTDIDTDIGTDDTGTETNINAMALWHADAHPAHVREASATFG